MTAPLDHEAAKKDATVFYASLDSPVTANLAACYLDLDRRHEELLRLANARLMGKYGAHEALRDFIEKENRHG